MGKECERRISPILIYKKGIGENSISKFSAVFIVNMFLITLRKAIGKKADFG